MYVDMPPQTKGQLSNSTQVRKEAELSPLSGVLDQMAGKDARQTWNTQTSNEGKQELFSYDERDYVSISEHKNTCTSINHIIIGSDCEHFNYTLRALYL